MKSYIQDLVGDEIVLVFENCEAMEVPKDRIAFLHMADITESITFTPQGGMVTFKMAEFLHIGVNNPSPELVCRCQKYKDITQIVMDNVPYLIKWSGDNDYENPNQTVCLRNGVLEIVVRKFEVWEFD